MFCRKVVAGTNAPLVGRRMCTAAGLKIAVKSPLPDAVRAPLSLSTANSKEILKYKVNERIGQFQQRPGDTGNSAVQGMTTVGAPLNSSPRIQQKPSVQWQSSQNELPTLQDTWYNTRKILLHSEDCRCWLLNAKICSTT